PRYIPSQFRNALEGAFRQEVQFHREMIAKFSQVFSDQLDFEKKSPENPIPISSVATVPDVSKDNSKKSNIRRIQIVHEFEYGKFWRSYFFIGALLLGMGFFLEKLLPPKFFDSIVKRFVQERIPASLVSQ